MGQLTTTRTLRGSTLTAGEIREFLRDVPNGETVRVTITPRDRPFDSETVNMSVTPRPRPSGDTSCAVPR
jgi:hypothetical protein